MEDTLVNQTDSYNNKIYFGGRAGSETNATVSCLTIRVLRLSSLLLFFMTGSGRHHLTLWVQNMDSQGRMIVP